jgi:hypothetical protein
MLWKGKQINTGFSHGIPNYENVTYKYELLRIIVKLLCIR